jgi:hypothetical protein
MNLAGADMTRTAFVIFLDLVMIITGLLGGLVTDELKVCFSSRSNFNPN